MIYASQRKVPCVSVGSAWHLARVVGLIPTGDQYKKYDNLCTHYCTSLDRSLLNYSNVFLFFKWHRPLLPLFLLLPVVVSCIIPKVPLDVIFMEASAYSFAIWMLLLKLTDHVTWTRMTASSLRAFYMVININLLLSYRCGTTVAFQLI